MTSPTPVLLAFVVHMVLHTTLFIHLDPGIIADTPVFGSQLFYLSVMDLLCDTEVIPTHWSNIPRWGKFILETIIAILIGETLMVGVWLSMETLLVNFINVITNWLGLGSRTNTTFQEIGTILLGVIFLVIVGAITNRPAKVWKMAQQSWRIITQQSRPSSKQKSFK